MMGSLWTFLARLWLREAGAASVSDLPIDASLKADRPVIKDGSGMGLFGTEAIKQQDRLRRHLPAPESGSASHWGMFPGSGSAPAKSFLSISDDCVTEGKISDASVASGWPPIIWPEAPAQAVPAPTGIEAEVCAEIARRQALGIAKYSQTVADNPLDLRAWLQHGLEEALDLAVYLKRAIAEIDKKGAP